MAFSDFVKLGTNLAGIYTKIPESDTSVKRTRHEAIIDRRHTKRYNPETEEHFPSMCIFQV